MFEDLLGTMGERKPDSKVSSCTETHARHAPWPKGEVWDGTMEQLDEDKIHQERRKGTERTGQDGIPLHTQTAAPSV